MTLERLIVSRSCLPRLVYIPSFWLTTVYDGRARGSFRLSGSSLPLAQSKYRVMVISTSASVHTFWR